MPDDGMRQQLPKQALEPDGADDSVSAAARTLDACEKAVLVKYSGEKMKGERRARLRRALVKLRRDFQWDWIERSDLTPVRRLTKKAANKFVLACIIDYQMNAGQQWENARRLAEDVLGDPPDLWDTIGAVPESAWLRRRNSYRWLHRFPAAHYRVWRIGRAIRDQYRGDARLIWKGRSAEDVHQRFLNLGLGTQLSRMAVGALLDTGHVAGSIDVKADINVCRVLGRILAGREFTPVEATETARLISPRNPWRLDAPLYRLGRDKCAASPNCTDCSMNDQCEYTRRHRRGRTRSV